MEQQTQAMCSMLAMLRARARVGITTAGRRERTRLCCQLVSLQHQKQTGNSKLGLSRCRESHRQKGGISQGASCGRRFENLRRPVSHTRLSACLLDDQGSLEVTLLNQLVVTTNVTTRRTGRKEGRKKGRKEGRTKRGLPTGIRTRDVRFYSYGDTTTASLLCSPPVRAWHARNVKKIFSYSGLIT